MYYLYEFKCNVVFGIFIIGKAADIDIAFRTVLSVYGQDLFIKHRKACAGLVFFKKRIQINGRRDIPLAFHDDQAVEATSVVSCDLLNGNGFRILDLCLQTIHDGKFEFFVCHYSVGMNQECGDIIHRLFDRCNALCKKDGDSCKKKEKELLYLTVFLIYVNICRDHPGGFPCRSDDGNDSEEHTI